MSKAVQNTTNVIMHDFNELAHLQSHPHSAGSFQDHAVRMISKQLAQSLERSYKKIPVLIDVPANVDDMGFEAFVITPLSGVENFMRHMNHFVTAVSYFKKGQLTAMLMFNPITNESFGTYHGCGGFYNHARMRVSKRPISQGMIALHGQGQNPEVSKMIYVSNCLYLDIVYVCSGRLEGVILHNPTIFERMIATLWSQETGGFITDMGNYTFLGNTKLS